VKKKRISNLKQIIFLLIIVILLISLAMLLEIKKIYDKEEFLSKERQELLNSTQIEIKEEVLEETPKVSCQESWFCTDWSDCRNNIQKRGCLDLNNCKDYLKKPEIEQAC
jgi:predicted Holliday junction resolvase-like endonuclease